MSGYVFGARQIELGEAGPDKDGDAKETPRPARPAKCTFSHSGNTWPVQLTSIRGGGGGRVSRSAKNCISFVGIVGCPLRPINKHDRNPTSETVVLCVCVVVLSHCTCGPR